MLDKYLNKKLVYYYKYKINIEHLFHYAGLKLPYWSYKSRS